MVVCWLFVVWSHEMSNQLTSAFGRVNNRMTDDRRPATRDRAQSGASPLPEIAGNRLLEIAGNRRELAGSTAAPPEASVLALSRGGKALPIDTAA